MPMYANNGGQKKVKNIWVNNGGSKKVKQAWVNVNGIAKKAFVSEFVIYDSMKPSDFQYGAYCAIRSYSEGDGRTYLDRNPYQINYDDIDGFPSKTGIIFQPIDNYVEYDLRPKSIRVTVSFLGNVNFTQVNRFYFIVNIGTNPTYWRAIYKDFGEIVANNLYTYEINTSDLPSDKDISKIDIGMDSEYRGSMYIHKIEYIY